MGKRSLVFLACLLFIISFTIPASAKINIELNAGLAMPNPTAFNTDFSNALANTYGNSFMLQSLGYNTLPSDVKGSNITQLFDGGANIKIFLGDSLALLLRGDYLGTDYEDDVSIDGVDCLYSHVTINGAFLGAGLAYYMNLNPKFSFFISGDGGMFIQFNSFYEIGANADPAAQAELASVNLPCAQNQSASLLIPGLDISNNVNFTDSGFGGHVELGLQFMLSDFFGISLHGGYQILSIPITYPGDLSNIKDVPFNFIDSSGNKVFKATSIDLSGPYFGGGIVLSFGNESGATAAAAGGGTSKYEQYGDYYYKQKNYAYAVRYYAGALKTAPNAGLYKKIGFTYYYLKDTAKAMYYLKEYVKQNPNDEQIRKWLGL